MDKPVYDFAVVVGNNVDAELDTFKLHNIISDPRIKNSRYIFSVRAVDVNVHRSGSLYFWNLLMGRPNIIGKFDLDKKREFTSDEDNTFLIKEGKPSMYLCLPDRFEDLPPSIKNHPVWGATFKLAYLQKQSRELQEQTLIEAGYQQAEINDILSQSQTKLSEFIMKQVSDYTQVAERDLKNQVKSGDVVKPGDGSNMY